MLRDLASIGYEGFLSIELLNESYWRDDLSAVARTAWKKAVSIVSTVAS
jgi:hypothetical protein